MMSRATALTEKEIKAAVRQQTGKSNERRLLSRKWSKKAQKELESREAGGSKPSTYDEPFNAMQRAIAASIREYLDEHDISVD